MIVDQAVYRDGERQSCSDLRAEASRLRDEPITSFLWIGLKDPTVEEFVTVQEQLGLELHDLAIEDAVVGDQRAKIERYDDVHFVVLKTLRYVERTSDVETGEVMLFVAPHLVITVRRGEHAPLKGVRRDLEQHSELLEHGSISVLHQVMDTIVDQYMEIDRELAVDLSDTEEMVFSPETRVKVESIYLLKREVLEAKRATQPLVEPLQRLMRSAVVAPEVLPFFRDINDHLMRVVEHVESYDRLLTDILSANLTQQSIEQNNDMRKISAWVAIAALPTMIAGIYGQNFEGMPELDASFQVGGQEVYYGYYVVLAIMAAACFTLYRLFKRSGWL